MAGSTAEAPELNDVDGGEFVLEVATDREVSNGFEIVS